MEVTISLGIAAFALLSLLAILAQAMDGAADAAGETIGAEIGARLMGELQLMDWETLTTETPVTRFFDEFGEEITRENGADTCVFSALQIVEPPRISMATSSGVEENTHGAKVSVVVADLPGKAGQDLISEFENSSTTSKRLHIFRSVVVNLEKSQAAD